jgi:hypothetical protein
MFCNVHLSPPSEAVRVTHRRNVSNWHKSARIDNGTATGYEMDVPEVGIRSPAQTGDI